MCSHCSDHDAATAHAAAYVQEKTDTWDCFAALRLANLQTGSLLPGSKVGFFLDVAQSNCTKLIPPFCLTLNFEIVLYEILLCTSAVMTREPPLSLC